MVSTLLVCGKWKDLSVHSDNQRMQLKANKSITLRAGAFKSVHFNSASWSKQDHMDIGTAPGLLCVGAVVSVSLVQELPGKEVIGEFQ